MIPNTMCWASTVIQTGNEEVRMRIDVIHMRDPDSSCDLMVYVDGEKVDHHEWSFDPGAGTEYTAEEYAEEKRNAVDRAPEGMKSVLAEIYDDFEESYERWSY
jgi:hypothetical protein